jgi:hypothetical protein
MSTRLPDPRLLDDVLPLLGDRACVIASPAIDGFGTDVDCAVRGLDPCWPLRLPPPGLLVRSERYDGSRGHMWLIERHGSLLLLDTLQDPDARGRYAFTTRVADECVDHVAPPHVTAAFRLAKYVALRTLDEERWASVRSLAAESPEGFRSLLAGILGPVGEELAEAALQGRPSDGLLHRARRAQLRRRARHPGALLSPIADACRGTLRRVARPRGIRVLIVGPDGVGKSRLADALPAASGDLFRRSLHRHWRPGLLPRPGALLRTQPLDPATPHRRARHGVVVSLALLVYYWLDFVLGGWLVLRPTVGRSVLVVLERGWPDLEVDPRRYRLRVPLGLVRMLGRLVPRLDLVLALEAPARIVAARKAELSEQEIERQAAAWRARLAGCEHAAVIDASAPPEEVVTRARSAVVEALERRAVSELAAGWIAFPRATPRLWLPRGPRRAAHTGLSVAIPTRPRPRVAWRAARGAAGLGASRLVARGQAPPRAVRALLAPYVPRGGTYAVARSTHEDRFVALVLDSQGWSTAFAKLAPGAEGRDALRREADNLAAMGPLLRSPLRAPRVLASENGLLVLAAATDSVAARPAKLTTPVAEALGGFHRAGASGARGPEHGDFAPWNLLEVAGGWLLVDWEDARADGLAFADLFHFFLQSRAYLGRPDPHEIVAGLRGAGEIGALLAAYARAAERPLEGARDSLVAYLDRSSRGLRDLLEREHAARLWPGTRAELLARTEVLSLLGG